MSVVEAVVTVCYITAISAIAIVGLFTQTVYFFWAAIFVALCFGTYDVTRLRGKQE